MSQDLHALWPRTERLHIHARMHFHHVPLTLSQRTRVTERHLPGLLGKGPEG